MDNFQPPADKAGGFWRDFAYNNSCSLYRPFCPLKIKNEDQIRELILAQIPNRRFDARASA